MNVNVPFVNAFISMFVCMYIGMWCVHYLFLCWVYIELVNALCSVYVRGVCVKCVACIVCLCQCWDTWCVECLVCVV